MIHKKQDAFVSVIIPVFNDSTRLKVCLQALENQTYPPDLYEIIVVDNGSKEPVEPIVAQFTQAQAAYESKPGSYAARNKGISLARGTVLAFTDSDCIPTSDWVERGVVHLHATPNCGLIGGQVQIFVEDPTNPTMIERFESIMAFPQKNYIEKDRFSVTANLFTFRHIVETVGLFNADIKSGGDRVWGQCVSAHGYSLVYAPDVCVAHPARRFLSQLYQKEKRIAGGIHDKKRHQRSFLRNVVGVLWSFIPPVRRTIQIIQDSRIKGVKQNVQFVLILFFYIIPNRWSGFA